MLNSARRKQTHERRPVSDHTRIETIPTAAPRRRSVTILGVRVAAESLTAIADTIVRWAAKPRVDRPARYVCATSVHGLVVGADETDFRHVLNRAAIVAADGMPLVWLGRLRGHPTMERVYGPDLMLEVCARSVEQRLRLFFYGGPPGVAEELATTLRLRFPGLIVAGTYSPPFHLLSAAELRGVVAEINATNPDIVWVGLSTPKQERWIASVLDIVETKVLISVGAAFDFHTGRVRQAPRLLQRLGLEWLYRVSREPRRLWRRYAYNVPKFIWLVLLEAAMRRRF